MSRVLVLGGTGFVGRHVCEKLTRRGWHSVVPTRREAHARHIQTLPLVDVLVGDVHDEATLTRLLDGCDAVVNLVAILHGDEASFDRVHRALPATLVKACARAGVKRLVHVSALGVDAQGPSMYQRSKAAGEAVLRASDLELTVLRPSVIFGAEDRFLNVFASLQGLFPLVPLAGADTRFAPVWVEDVAEAVVRCLDRPDTVGQTFEAFGPQVLSLRELVQAAGRWAGVAGGRGRPVIGLPLALGRLQARLMGLMPGEPLMSVDNVDSLQVDNLPTGQFPSLAALGITPAALDAVAPGYLSGGGLRQRLLGYRRRAGRL